MKPSAGLKAFRFGVNYTPSKDWWYCWNDFKPDDIARDFDAISGLCADHLRIMLLWPFFQPNPSWVSPAHLSRLETLLELAAARGLDVCVSVFCGHLTGQNFRPGYERSQADFFEGAEMLLAQRLLLESLAKALNPHANFLGFDLGNELNCCWSVPSPALGDAWHRRTLALAESLSPGRVHVNGVDHLPWFAPSPFSPRALAETQSILALHSWIKFTGALELCGGDASKPECVGLPAAMAALARSYAGDPAKPVWCQEFGASEEWMDAKAIPSFLERSMNSAIRGGVAWHSLWASHDIDPKFKVNKLEYTLGLLDCSGRMKPQGKVFASIASAWRGRKVETPSFEIPPPPSRLEQAASWAWLRDFLRANPQLSEG